MWHGQRMGRAVWIEGITGKGDNGKRQSQEKPRSPPQAWCCSGGQEWAALVCSKGHSEILFHLRNTRLSAKQGKVLVGFPQLLSHSQLATRDTSRLAMAAASPASASSVLFSAQCTCPLYTRCSSGWKFIYMETCSMEGFGDLVILLLVSGREQLKPVSSWVFRYRLSEPKI